MLPDVKDILCFGGAMLLFYGLWQVWPPLAFIVTGGLGVFAGARAYERKYQGVKNGNP
jgi:hypothetical protein